MCLPTAVAGLVFPATVRLATERGRLGGRLGRVYAVNTVGTMAGALLTGLVFFHWFGLEGCCAGCWWPTPWPPSWWPSATSRAAPAAASSASPPWC
ncbi:MAG: hypothetical protein R3F43_00730 [bacterium]